jgi:hypothetical protein
MYSSNYLRKTQGVVLALGLTAAQICPRSHAFADATSDNADTPNGTYGVLEEVKGAKNTTANFAGPYDSQSKNPPNFINLKPPSSVQEVVSNLSVGFYPYEFHASTNAVHACGGHYLALDPIWNGTDHYNWQADGVSIGYNLESATGIKDLSLFSLTFDNSVDRISSFVGFEKDYRVLNNIIPGLKIGGAVGFDLFDGYRAPIPVGGGVVVKLNLGEVVRNKALESVEFVGFGTVCSEVLTGVSGPGRCQVAFMGGLQLNLGKIPGLNNGPR